MLMGGNHTVYGGYTSMLHGQRNNGGEEGANVPRWMPCALIPSLEEDAWGRLQLWSEWRDSMRGQLNARLFHQLLTADNTSLFHPMNNSTVQLTLGHT